MDNGVSSSSSGHGATAETMSWATRTNNLWVINAIRDRTMGEIVPANEESNCFGFAATGLSSGHLLPSGGASASEAAFNSMFTEHGWSPALLPPEGPQLVLYKAHSDIGFAGHAAVWMVYAPHDSTRYAWYSKLGTGPLVKLEEGAVQLETEDGSIVKRYKKTSHTPLLESSGHSL